MSFATWLERFNARLEARVDQAFPADAPSEPETDLKEPVRWGWRIFWVITTAVLLWGTFAPLDQGVPVSGFVGVEGSRKTIQHLRGGIVEEILVREGDSVVVDQVLIRLNEAQVQAQQGSITSQLLNTLAVEARLVAERAGRDKVVFPPFLLERKDVPRVQEAMQVQEQLFHTRRAALAGEIAIATETIAGLNQQIVGLEAQERSKVAQLKLYDEEFQSLKPMYEQGFVPRNRMFDLERAIAFINGQRSEEIANIGRAKSQIGELKLKILQAREVFRKDVETQLTDVRRAVDDLTERRGATQDDLDRVLLRAPVAGTVVDVSVTTIGGVITPGQKLMDVVPTGGKLQVEVKIPTNLIDNVQAGLDAHIHFLALDQTIVPAVPGILTYVSADRMTDPRTDMSYYSGKLSITAEGVAKLGNHGIVPGMPADAVIITGSRSFFSYMLKPLVARLQFAFTER
jgi:membrane fusion protein, protease secretion system